MVSFRFMVIFAFSIALVGSIHSMAIDNGFHDCGNRDNNNDGIINENECADSVQNLIEPINGDENIETNSTTVFNNSTESSNNGTSKSVPKSDTTTTTLKQNDATSTTEVSSHSHTKRDDSTTASPKENSESQSGNNEESTPSPLNTTSQSSKNVSSTSSSVETQNGTRTNDIHLTTKRFSKLPKSSANSTNGAFTYLFIIIPFIINLFFF
ncbi:hypothetical protein RDWZM_005135 [Blomia tropicalis]|uniref:Uncharacterized protein n=1 Tax=Blomia tropicalis TaxID=40697 RepID=A0A9Q0RKL8_BLOTA|nr:hypothetical protein BLOT_005578 [Blomia tropicalis]KAJ6219323.1 hypothetical protein RDWZM_005135 [Blomia tropicalis]